MSEKYRATDKDWEEQEYWFTEGDTAARCLLELRSRVELLEATQHAHLDGSQLSEAEREAQKEPGRVVAGQPEPPTLATDDDLRDVFDEGPGTVVDGFRDIYDLGRQHGARAAAIEADNATAATVAEIRSSLFNAPAQPAPAVKDSLTAAPAGSLVERVAGRLRAACGLQDGQWDEAAIDVIHGVADWLRENDSEREMGGDAAATADLIEQEASR